MKKTVKKTKGNSLQGKGKSEVITKQLPIGIQSFRKLRENGCVYVDKTHHILDLMSSGGNVYFLSRPRRFGKSLLISAIEEAFLGNKSLFEGLYIYDKIEWINHPVIRLDFDGAGSYNTPQALINSLNEFIDQTAIKHEIIADGLELPLRFQSLIMKLHKKYNRQVVVLIDECDKPVIDHLDNPATASANRNILRSFYQVLKASGEHLRFVFLTDVLKISEASVFSGLNHLNDITLDTRYSTICGFTQEELELNFDNRISDLMAARKIKKLAVMTQIKQTYSGYSWDGVSMVYNPFSTLMLFDKNKFDTYWSATGTSSFLIKLLNNTDLSPVLKPVTTGAMGFNSVDPDAIDTLPLLFQTGYLTVKTTKTNRISMMENYTLGIPNMEIHDAFLSDLLTKYSGCSAGQTGSLKNKMQEQLLECDEEGFRQSMRQMFANIPCQFNIPRETWYHSLLLLWIKLLGFEVQSEIVAIAGSINAICKWDDYVVIAELKYLAQEEVADDSIPKLLDNAMAQIHEHRYYDSYLDGTNKVNLLAVAFAGKETGCKIESIAPAFTIGMGEGGE
ncbi:MAG: ATP-binding protein [Cytophagaceae bacterium]|nr:ATP-binding protein [Cytophagaceae bacterium]